MDFQTAESLDTQLLKDIITGGATETQEDSMILGLFLSSSLSVATHR